MPLYEYVCSQCRNRIEVVQKVSDPPLKRCKSCGAALKKVISRSAIKFKGNGWYITDYARKSPPQKEEKREEKGKSKEEGSPKASPEKRGSSSSKD